MNPVSLELKNSLAWLQIYFITIDHENDGIGDCVDDDDDCDDDNIGNVDVIRSRF